MKNWKLSMLFNTPLRLVVALGLLIMLVEMLIMTVIHDALVPMNIPDVYGNSIDAILLTIIIFPVLYSQVFQKLRSEERLRQINVAAQDAIVIVDEQGRLTDWNPAAQRMFQYSQEEALGRQMHQLLAPARYQVDAERGFAHFKKMGEGPLVGKIREIVAIRKDGSEFPVEIYISQLKVKDCWHAVGVMRDITGRKAAEAKIQRLSRLYAALSQCNQAIVRCTDEIGLFSQVCRDAVQSGGFSMAWIGLVDEASLRVVPVASYGEGVEYLENIVISVDADEPSGRGPTGIAIREDRPFWCQNFPDDPLTAPWHESGRRFGWGALASLPLHRNGVAVGTFVLYSGEANAFDADARHLLVEMETDISYALDNFVREAQRIRAENDARLLTQRITLATDAAAIGIWDWHLPTDQWYATPTYFTMLGYEAEPGFLDRELWLERTHPEDRDAVSGAIQAVLSGRDVIYQYEARIRHADGSYRWVNVVGRVAERDENGKAVRMLGVRIDITVRKQMALALAGKETRLRTLLGAMPDLIWLKDEDGVYQSCNPMFERFFGASEADIVGKTDYDFVDKELADLFRSHDRKAMAAGKPSVNEEWVRFADDGHRALLETIKTPMYESSGKLIGVLGIARDITERKQAGEMLRKLSLAVEQSPSSIIITDLDAKIEYVNTAFLNVTGYSLAEIIGQNPRILHSGKNPKATYDDMWAHLMRGEVWKGEFINRRKDGSEYIESVLTSPVRQPDGQVTNYLAIKDDITQRRQVENALRVSRENLYRLLNSMAEGTYGVDTNGDCTFVNQSFLQMLGYQNENEVLGKHIHELIHHSHADGSPYAAHECRAYRAYRLNQSINVSDEVFWRRDGVAIPVEYWSHPIESDGVVLGAIVTFVDITERKRSEQEIQNLLNISNQSRKVMLGMIEDQKLTEEKLRQLNDKLEEKVAERTTDLERARLEADHANQAKSAFLAAMSHEIRTPMNGVIGMLEVLQQSSLTGQQIEMANIIHDSAFSLLSIINDILDFSKIEAGKLQIDNEPMSVADVVEGACETIDRMALKKGVGMTLFTDPAIPALVMGDAGRLRQILINLSNNAVKFSSGQDRPGSVSVRVLLIEGGLESMPEQACLEPGRKACLESGRKIMLEFRVADNGIGMNEATLAQLFTAFTQ
ncbi:MAG: PAS domain S-box protein, partial [Gallionella sp.]